MELKDIIVKILSEYVNTGKVIAEADILNIAEKIANELYLDVPSVKSEIAQFITTPFPLERKEAPQQAKSEKIKAIELKSGKKVLAVVETPPTFTNYVLVFLEGIPEGYRCHGYVENLQDPHLSEFGDFIISKDMTKRLA